jgi:lipopolysaccharide export system protein LptC
VKTRVVHLLPLLMMLFLAALTLWVQYALVNGTGGEPRLEKHEPDAIVDNFTVRRLDENGKLLYTFSAPKMFHYPDTRSGEVLYPRVARVADDGGDFTATANRGVVEQLGEKTFLYGNVVVSRGATPGNPELRITTDFLQVLSEQGITRTDHSVTIVEGGTTLTGVGLVANERKGQFSLKSQVRGTFDAPKPR